MNLTTLNMRNQKRMNLTMTSLNFELLDSSRALISSGRIIFFIHDMFDVATEEDKKISRPIEACTMFITNVVQEVLATPHPTIGVEGGKDTVSEGVLPRIVVDIVDNPPI